MRESEVHLPSSRNDARADAVPPVLEDAEVERHCSKPGSSSQVERSMRRVERFNPPFTPSMIRLLMLSKRDLVLRIGVDFLRREHLRELLCL